MASSEKEPQQQYGGFDSTSAGPGTYPPQPQPPPYGQPYGAPPEPRAPGAAYPPAAPPPPGYFVMAAPFPQRYEPTPEERRSPLRMVVWPLAILSCFCGGVCLGLIPIYFACECPCVPKMILFKVGLP